MDTAGLRSFKLQRRERRVRVVPSVDPQGCPFSGPGVDLLDERCDAILTLAHPLFDGIAAFEPGVEVRSVSVDLERPRLLITLESPGRPRVVRLDEPSLVERLLAPCAALLALLSEMALQALLARSGHTPEVPGV